MNIKNKIINLSKSVVSHASNNFKLVTDDILNNRRDICVKCDKFNAANITCAECGCYLLIKTEWASEKCPLDKWGIEEIGVVNIDRPNADLSISPYLYQDTPLASSTNFTPNIYEDANIAPFPVDCGCNKNNV